MAENDEIEEAVDTLTRSVTDAVRSAAMAASVVGQRHAEQRRVEFERQARLDEHQRREWQQRYDAELQAARSQLQPVQNATWWDNARLEDITAAVTTAAAWRGQDADIDAADSRINTELSRRYGINMDVHNERRVPHLLRRDFEDRTRADRERGNAAENDRNAHLESEVANAADGQAVVSQHENGEATDAQLAAASEHQDLARSADNLSDQQRRVADRLEGTGESAAAEARVRVAAGEAQPAREAVRNRPKNAAAHSRGRSRRVPQRQRGVGR